MNQFRQLAEFDQHMTAIRNMLPQVIEFMPYLAKLYMEYYKALKAEGFTDDQALYLVGLHGTSLGITGDTEDF